MEDLCPSCRAGAFAEGSFYDKDYEHQTLTETVNLEYFENLDYTVNSGTELYG